MTVMIGIDPHKASHTAVVIDNTECVLDELRVRACSKQRSPTLADSSSDRRAREDNQERHEIQRDRLNILNGRLFGSVTPGPDNQPYDATSGHARGSISRARPTHRNPGLTQRGFEAQRGYSDSHQMSEWWLSRVCLILPPANRDRWRAPIAYQAVRLEAARPLPDDVAAVIDRSEPCGESDEKAGEELRHRAQQFVESCPL
jgi:hypothetical protein